MVTRGEEYVEKGMDVYEKRRIDRTFASLNRKARTLGYWLVEAVVDEEVPSGAPAAAQLLERETRGHAVAFHQEGRPFRREGAMRKADLAAEVAGRASLTNA